MNYYLFKVWLCSIFMLSNLSAFTQLKYSNDLIITGADQTEKYLPLISGKRVGVLANPTTIIGTVHLVDSLQKLGIDITRVFGPEHGFRGNKSNGDDVHDEIDAQSGIKIVSLYGNKHKPSPEDLAAVDIMIFDVQDVGCRFYTYIKVLRDVMEACAEEGKELIILDRPNPNGYLIDGPILDMALTSGIGQFPIPIAHGLTTAEMAQMINGEAWMATNLPCKLTIIPVAHYTHDMLYKLPVAPSPNLNTEESILLYPSTCLYEGISLNHGRGTDSAFTRVGSPWLKGIYEFSYIPVSKPGMSESPIYMNQQVWGKNLALEDLEALVLSRKINLSWLIELYQNYPKKEQFFDRSISNQIGNIDYLAGVYDFKKQIMNGVSEAEIRASWEPGLEQYKKMRQKYLLYP